LIEVSKNENDLRARWDAATIEKRRTLVAAAIQEVTVGPGRRTGGGFDHERVRVRFRGRPS
jgi:hypothetical protein